MALGRSRRARRARRPKLLLPNATARIVRFGALTYRTSIECPNSQRCRSLTGNCTLCQGGTLEPGWNTLLLFGKLKLLDRDQKMKSTVSWDSLAITDHQFKDLWLTYDPQKVCMGVYFEWEDIFLIFSLQDRVTHFHGTLSNRLVFVSSHVAYRHPLIGSWTGSRFSAQSATLPFHRLPRCSAPLNNQ